MVMQVIANHTPNRTRRTLCSHKEDGPRGDSWKLTVALAGNPDIFEEPPLSAETSAREGVIGDIDSINLIEDPISKGLDI